MKTVLIPTKLDTVASDLLTQHGDYKVVQDEGTTLPELAAAHYTEALHRDPANRKAAEGIKKTTLVPVAG